MDLIRFRSGEETPTFRKASLAMAPCFELIRRPDRMPRRPRVHRRRAPLCRTRRRQGRPLHAIPSAAAAGAVRISRPRRCQPREACDQATHAGRKRALCAETVFSSAPEDVLCPRFTVKPAIEAPLQVANAFCLDEKTPTAATASSRPACCPS